jgi:hypothetical protein
MRSATDKGTGKADADKADAPKGTQKKTTVRGGASKNTEKNRKPDTIEFFINKSICWVIFIFIKHTTPSMAFNHINAVPKFKTTIIIFIYFYWTKWK